MSAELRRYPRFDFSAPATVALGSDEDDQVFVEVVCLSCEGAGVTVASQSRAVLPGSLVRLRFWMPDSGEVDLPARVMWAAGGKAGLRFRLADCDPDSKQSFGAWIAPRTKQALAERRANPRAATVV